MHRKRIRLTTIGPLVIFAILFVVFSIIFVVSTLAGSQNIQSGVDNVSRPVLTITSELLFNPLYNLDITGLTTILDPYVDGTTAVYAAVYDVNGKQVVEINKKWAPDSALSHALALQALTQTEIIKHEVGDYLILTKSIAVGTVSIGTVEIVFDQAPLRASLGRAQTTISITLVVALILSTLLFFILIQYALNPLNRLAGVAEAIARGNFAIEIPQEGSDEVGFLAAALAALVGKLSTMIATLEQRVAERTQSLELAAQVGRAVSQVQALDIMLKDAAEIIRSRFDLYYVQVYLADPSFTNLILQSGTGEVGAELVGRGHHLPLNTNSINGRAAIEQRSLVVTDTSTSLSFHPNPLLPDTRSEMAIPLMVGEKVVGVLDLQSQTANALNQELLPAFEALAGQLAIAIQNANLLAETEQARAEVESQARRLVRAGWQDYQDAIHTPEQVGFLFENNQVTALVEVEQPEIATNQDALAAPISVTGEKIGTLVVEMEEQKRSSQAEYLMFAVARQVAQKIENLRLLESAERYRSEAEQAIRRQTREGWQAYIETRSGENLGYLYERSVVKPAGPENQISDAEAAVSLPLKVRDEAIGKLAISGLASEDNEALSLVSEVADRLGAHIESLRQFEETKRGQFELDKRASQLAAVAEVSTVSARELDIQKLLETVVHLTQRRFDLYHAHVFIYNEASSELSIAACGWKEGDENEGSHGTTTILLAQEQSLVARAARTRQAVIVNDVRNEPGWLPNPLLPDTRAEVAVPLFIGEQLLGVLDVQSDHLEAFSQEDANIYATLASQVATALQNARSFAQAQQQAKREATLNSISQKIQSATSVEAVLQIAARELGHALGAPRTIAQLSMKDKN